MCRKPVITAPAHSGMAILRFMDSWVVGVNVCGKRPRRFVDPINMIRETIIRVHVRPFGVWISIICLIISLTSQCWKEWRRLLQSDRKELSSVIRLTLASEVLRTVWKSFYCHLYR